MCRNSLNRNWFSLFYCPFLAWHFVHFHARHDNPCPILSSMPSMTFFFLSLCVFFHHAGHEHSVWAPVSLSFGKWGVWHKRETILMSIKQFFFRSLLPLFQLTNLYLMFSCPCNIKRVITINLNSYTPFNYVRAWRKIFHAEAIKFQDLSRNFSLQDVKSIRTEIKFRIKPLSKAPFPWIMKPTTITHISHNFLTWKLGRVEYKWM